VHDTYVTRALRAHHARYGRTENATLRFVHTGCGALRCRAARAAPLRTASDVNEPLVCHSPGLERLRCVETAELVFRLCQMFMVSSIMQQ